MNQQTSEGGSGVYRWVLIVTSNKKNCSLYQHSYLVYGLEVELIQSLAFSAISPTHHLFAVNKIATKHLKIFSKGPCTLPTCLLIEI